MVRLLTGILALAVWAAPASAATYIVDRFDESPDATTCSPDQTDKDCSLRGAILAANAHAGPDTILVRGGVYTLTLTGDEQTVGDAGDLDVTETVSIQGSDTIIQGCQPVAPATDCVGLDRILHVHGGQSPVVLTMSGVTLQHGTTKGGGGGVLVDPAATLKLSNAVVRQNAADGAGGGIAVSAGGSVTLTDSLVAANTSGGQGGGIFLGALGPDPAAGGTVAVTRSTVQDNVAGAGGGGIACLTGALTVSASTIAHNQSAAAVDEALAGSGGGVFIGLGDDAASVISNSTVSGNVGHVAGGIVASGTLVLRDVTVTLNEMHSDGSGAGGVATLGALQMQNTIVAGNVADVNRPADCLGGVVSGGYNLVGDGDQCGLVNGAGGDQVGTAAAPIDPKLGPLTLNSGSTRTHALLPGSPAIDAGNPAAPESSVDACTLNDQRGTARGLPQTGRCDIGAFELFGSGTTTTTVESTTSTTESTTSTTEVTTTTVIVVTTSTTVTPESTTSTTESTTSSTATTTSTETSSSTTTSTTETTTSTSSTSTSSSSTSTTSSTAPPRVEICGNCIDDDGNGLTDFEDPACCAQLQLAAMNVQKATLATAKGNTTLKLSASLVQTGLSTGPAADQDVHLQVRVGDADVLCARIPAASLTRKKNTLRFRDKKHAVASAAGIDTLVLKGKKTGAGALSVGGSRLAITLPAAGDVQITLGLRNPTTAETGNRCTTANIALKTGRKGGLKFP